MFNGRRNGIAAFPARRLLSEREMALIQSPTYYQSSSKQNHTKDKNASIQSRFVGGLSHSLE
jgi:hypothetical protein